MSVRFRPNSWTAESIAWDNKKAAAYPFRLTDQVQERPCELCGKMTRMIRKQKYCKACSMIPYPKRKLMLAGKGV